MTTQFQKYLAASKAVDGWFLDEAAATWDCLLEFQQSAKMTGNLLEIGVWDGKSALMSVLHAQSGEIQLLVDPRDLKVAQANLRQLRGDAAIDAFQKPSRSLFRHPEYRNMLTTFRWIHIDGRHSAQDVSVDLRLADELLNDNGMVVLDDFFHQGYPQVTEAAYQYLFSHPHSFGLLLCGHRKGYLCRPLALAKYADYVRTRLHQDLVARGFDQLTVWKTTESADCQTFGITERFLDFDYRGPDWAQKTVPV
ncbi:MAG: class I SAM-dependent methyltransferase [Hyphomicrobiales bacterium]|uniref:class I SAM-dependent methyltransferase n=1 Tax=Aestuariivirga sp. TaxID=2650926 RepID=UPI0035AFA3B3